MLKCTRKQTTRIKELASMKAYIFALLSLESGHGTVGKNNRISCLSPV